MATDETRRSKPACDPGLLDGLARAMTGRYQRAEHEVRRAMAEALTLEQAAPGLLRALGEAIGCEIAELWVVTAVAPRARQLSAWRRDGRPRAAMDAADRDPGRPSDAAPDGVRVSIGADGQQLGWLVFHGAEALASDEELSRLIGYTAGLVARFIERTSAGEALRTSEARLRAVIDSAPLMLFALDRSGIVVFSEGMGLLALGIKPGELVGRSVQEVYAHNPTAIDEIRRALSGESFTGLVEEAGLVFETRWVANRGPDGELLGTTGVAVDVTDRKQAETALFQSEERLRYVTMATRDAVYDWDLLGGRIWRNEAYQGLFPSDAEPCEDRDRRKGEIHPEDRQRVLESVEAAFQSRSSSWSGEYRLRRHDGRYASVVDRGYVLYDREGRAIRMIGAITDISQRTTADALRDGQSRVLESIARDAPIDEILNILCLVIEGQSEGLLCSVVLLDDDGVHVRHCAAPSLPDAYVKALDGAAIGPRRGSCGTAMYYNRMIIVTDVLVDPRWDDHRDLALQNGFRACWSIPIVAHDGKVLGSFAMYYREPRSPSPMELELIELAARLGGIALERHRSGEQLRSSLQEKDVLLKEIHHRVKNNLQVVSSLLALQGRQLEDPRVMEAFTESQNRVRAMALVHEALYRSGDLARVHFATHVESMCAQLFRSYNAPSRIHLELAVADVGVDLDHAIPCGLIINELVSNALKHAFPGDRDGHVFVGFEISTEGSYALTVADDGIGLPEGLDPQRAETLGLQLVTDLTEQLAGTLVLDRREGTAFTVRFAEQRKDAQS